MYEYLLLLVFIIVVIALIFIYRSSYSVPGDVVPVNPIPLSASGMVSVPVVNPAARSSLSTNPSFNNRLVRADPSSGSALGETCTPQRCPDLSYCKKPPECTPGTSQLSTGAGLTSGQEPQLYLYVDSQGQIQVRVKSPVMTIALSSLPQATARLLTAGAEGVTLRADIQLPATFDPRKESPPGQEHWPEAITNPLDQVSCGSCWAFATATCLSDRYRIKNPNTTDASPEVKELYKTFCYSPGNPATAPYRSMNNVSPYQVVRCITCPKCKTDKDCLPGQTCVNGNCQPCMAQCTGGVIPHAFDYLISNGANSITCIGSAPLSTQQDTPCTLSPDQVIYQGKQKIQIMGASPQETISKIKQELFTNGPVVAGFTVYESLYEYKSGVITELNTSGKIAGGHAVVIIGWGVENGQEYWIIRNSWGILGSTKGYFNMAVNWRPLAAFWRPEGSSPYSQPIPTLGILDEVWTISV